MACLENFGNVSVFGHNGHDGYDGYDVHDGHDHHDAIKMRLHIALLLDGIFKVNIKNNGFDQLRGERTLYKPLRRNNIEKECITKM